MNENSLHDRMYRDQLIFKFDLGFSRIHCSTKKQFMSAYTKRRFLTMWWVWLNFTIQLRTNAWAHVQRQTQVFEPDLNLASIQLNINQYTSTCTKSNSFFELTWSLLKCSIKLKKPWKSACAKTDSFYLSLTWVWLQCSSLQTQKHKITCTMSKYFLSLTWIWLKSTFQN